MSTNSTPQAVILSALRTPIGALGGVLADVRPDDLAARVLRTLVERSGLPERVIEEVYLGCANQAGEDNRNIARMATILAGLPIETGGVTFNRLCASGLAAVTGAARAIRCGEGDVFLAGGVESMSRAPYSLPKAHHAYPFGNLTAWDTALGWRYPHAEMMARGYTLSMGETAENLAEKFNITREEQDALALESHRRAIAAQESGKFAEEIIPFPVPHKQGDVMVEHDERPRRETSMANLARLKPAFKTNGTVTAGNSSGMNDGAAGLILASESKAARLDIQPLARVVCSAAAGVDPREMGLGPVYAVRKLLSRADVDIKQIGLFEINEAFAAQTIAVMRELELDPAITNVNGGAIALGHPLGCSGARILTTLLHEMGRRAQTAARPFYGIAALCVGVGQGEAMLVEWLG